MRRILILLAVFFLAGCRDRDNVFVQISVPDTVSSIPLLELDSTKIDDKIIKVRFYQDHIVAMSEFLSGRTDIVMTGFTQGVMNYNENKNIVQLTCPVWGASSIISVNQSIKSLEDMNGLTIAVPFQGSPLDVQLRYILKEKKLSDVVDIEYFPPQQAAALLVSGKVDAICVPEPVASKLDYSGVGRRIETFAGMWEQVNNGDSRSPQVSIFTDRKFADKNRVFSEHLLKELNEVLAQLINNEESIKKYAEIFGVSEEVIRLSLNYTLYDIPDYDETYTLCNGYLVKIGSKVVPGKDFYFNARK